MIVAKALQFEGYSPKSWRALIELALRFFEPEDGLPLGAGMLVVLTEQESEHALVWHSKLGPLPSIPYPLESSLREICERHGVTRGIRLHSDAWRELMARASIRIHRESDVLFQSLTLMKTFIELVDEGLVELWPEPSAWRRLPPASTLAAIIEKSLPETCAVVAVAWRRNAVESAVIARRLRGTFDLVAGPEQLDRWTGPLGGAWRRDYRIMLRAVQEHVAPVHVGLFAEAHTFESLLKSRQVGALSHSIAVRELIVQPMPAALAVVAGADAAAAVTKGAARMVRESELAHRIGPIGRSLGSRARRTMSLLLPMKNTKLFDKS